jgi:hypothetical protein
VPDDPNIEARRAARARGAGPKPADNRISAVCFLLRACEGFVQSLSPEEDPSDIPELALWALKLLGVTDHELRVAAARLDAANAAEMAAG